jgi:hypothetical protein
MASDLDKDLEVEKRRRGNTVPRDFTFTESISRIVEQASNVLSQQPATREETTRSQQILAASIEDEASFRPATGSVGSSMAAEMDFLHSSEDRARPRGSLGASLDAENSLVSQAIQRSSDAVRVEGDTIIYDLEKILFEAQKIKFDGLSLPSNNVTATQMMQESATPQVAMSSSPSTATRMSSTSTAESAGMQPIRVNNQPMVALGGGTAGGGATGTPTPSSASAVMQFFIAKGWTPAQAAGFAANLQVESNFNPAAVGDGGRAYGIAQWHPDRQRNFQAWSGRDIRGSTVEQQLEFMHFEMTQGAERRAGSMIRQTTTPEQAAAVIDQYYERSNGHARARRMQLAASYAANAPTSPAQIASNPASSAPVLAQASTDRIQADREQIRNTHRMLREFNQQSNISDSQLRQIESNRISEKKQSASGEVSLRSRILGIFDHLAQAS